MELLTLLQTAVDPQEVAQQMDSMRVVTHEFAQTLVTEPETALRQLGNDAIQFGIKVLAALAIYVVGAWLIRRVKKLLLRIFSKRNTDKTLSSFIISFVSTMMTVLLIVITISTLGVNTTSLAALLAAGGMAIGMALSGTVQNFAGGIMLLAFKPFKVGDFIEAQGFTGTVTEVSIVNTKLTTTDNKAIIIPNGALSNGNINNYSRFPLRRLEWQIGLEYGTDSAACMELLLTLLKADKRVLDASTPGAADPFVALSSLDDSAVVFVVRGWVRSNDYWAVFYDFNNVVYTELPKKGFNFPFPQLDVHLPS